MEQIRALGVYLHDRLVGILNRLAGDQHVFSFEEDYIHDAQRATLSLSFKGQTGGLVTRARPVSRRLPPFFSNLLPEGHLRDYLAERAGVKKEREFLLIAVLGADLAGAVVVKPIPGEDSTKEAAEQATETRRSRKGMLRFSLAGVQLKFSAIAEASGGLTIPAHGVGGSWIVKLPSSRFAAVPANEYAMLQLARAVGITVPSLRLVRPKEVRGLPHEAANMGGHALAVERFDRTRDGSRIHMEDFAQVFGLFPDDKYGPRSYANIAAVLWAETGEAGTLEFVRRLAFSILIGNGDMHLKNWSLLYPDGRTPALAPAYDFVSTVPYMKDDRLALSFGGERSLGGITQDQVRKFTATARLPHRLVSAVVQETVERTVDGWRDLPERDMLPNQLRKAIDQQIHRASNGTR